MAKRLVAQEVNDFVTKRKPDFVCDLCVVKGLGLGQRAHANQITAALGTTSEFERKKGFCPDCKAPDVMVIRAVDPAQATASSELNFRSILIEFDKVNVKIVK